MLRGRLRFAPLGALVVLLALFALSRLGPRDDGQAGTRTVEPSPAAGNATPVEVALASTAIPLQDVTFLARLPEGTSGPVTLRVMGLHEFDFVRSVELQARADGLWQASVPIEEGALIRYRYDRGRFEDFASLSDRREAPHESLTTLWRLLPVTPDLAEVQDTVAMWSDARTAVPRGGVTGVVLDASTGAPVVDAEVEVDGMHTATTFDGSFSLVEVAAGEHRVTAHHADGRYQPASAQVIVTDGGEARAELRLASATPVDVTFDVELPDDTPEWAEVRLLGNTEQTGGWGASAPNLSNDLVSPVLERAVNGTARVTLHFYEGQHVMYRYNLGFQGWNDEDHAGAPGENRQFIVSAAEPLRAERVERWGPDGLVRLVLRVQPPDNSPPGTPVLASIGPSHWLAPVDGEWRAVLYGRPGDTHEVRYAFGGGGETGEDVNAPHVLTFPGSDGEAVYRVTAWKGIESAAALADGERGTVRIRLSLGPEDAGRNLRLAGDAPFAGAALAGREGNPTVVEAEVTATKGTYTFSVEG